LDRVYSQEDNASAQRSDEVFTGGSPPDVKMDIVPLREDVRAPLMCLNLQRAAELTQEISQGGSPRRLSRRPRSASTRRIGLRPLWRNRPSRSSSTIKAEASESGSSCEDGSLGTTSSTVSWTSSENSSLVGEQLSTRTNDEDDMSSASTCYSRGKVCKHCKKRYNGFGLSCGACRKARVRVQKCRVCTNFFSGCTETCEDCLPHRFSGGLSYD